MWNRNANSARRSTNFDTEIWSTVLPKHRSSMRHVVQVSGGHAISAGRRISHRQRHWPLDYIGSGRRGTFPRYNIIVRSTKDAIRCRADFEGYSLFFDRSFVLKRARAHASFNFEPEERTRFERDFSCGSQTSIMLWLLLYFAIGKRGVWKKE